MSKIIPVILCGGSGTRLWPLSRQKLPKQFLKLTDNDTLLQKTIRRTLDILGSDGSDVVTITLRSLRDATFNQLHEITPLLTQNLLLEPHAKNTAAAVAFAIHYVQEKFGSDSLLWVLPADHFVGDEDALKNALLKAKAVAVKDYMVTFGIKPTRPETGYGYIRKATKLNGSGSYDVDAFIEKPEQKTAEEFVSSGNYLWSSGMHLFRAQVGQKNFQELAPQTWNVVKNSILESGDQKQPSSMTYRAVREEPFEIAVMERAEKVAVIPCDPKWSDIGCWESLWEIRKKDESGNALDGNVLCQDTKNSMILSQDRLVTCVGLENIIIIETGDSVLVADKNSNGGLKTLVQTLQKMKRQETISSPTVHHSWGRIRLIAETIGLNLREVVIKSEKIISEDSLGSGNSQWVVTSGRALFISDGIKKEIAKNQTFWTNQDTFYSVSSMDSNELKLFEIHYTKVVPGNIANPVMSVPMATRDMTSQARLAA